MSWSVTAETDMFGVIEKQQYFTYKPQSRTAPGDTAGVSGNRGYDSQRFTKTGQQQIRWVSTFRPRSEFSWATCLVFRQVCIRHFFFTLPSTQPLYSPRTNAPAGCGGAEDLHFNWLADKSVMTVWCHHVGSETLLDVSWTESVFPWWFPYSSLLSFYWITVNILMLLASFLLIFSYFYWVAQHFGSPNMHSHVLGPDLFRCSSRAIGKNLNKN